VFQAACIAVLAGFGVAGADALAYGLVLQATEILTSVVLGVVALAGEGLSWRQLRRAAAADG
jgi:phosphatidylinositol alpha-mannosyltransferase